MKKNLFFFSIVLLFCSCAVKTMSVSKEMILTEGGDFTMGQQDEKWNQPHQVILDSFFIAKDLVTVKEWKVFLEDTGLPFNWDLEEPQSFNGKLNDLMPTDDCPAQGLNWYYAIAYCNWLSLKDGLKPCYKINGVIKDDESTPEVIWNKHANGYRLPTDAEWEYAARGGRLSKGFLYAGSNISDEIAKTRQKRSYPVGKMKPNELGLNDMTGNVAAWCWDWFDTNPELVAKKQNPTVDNIADVKNLDEHNPDMMKVLRGMDWMYGPFSVFIRDHYPPRYTGWIGIRLVRNAK